MAEGSHRAILLFTGLLILISLIAITLDERSSNNIIFVVIFSTSVIILLWKLLSTQAKSREQYNSAPIDYGENLTNQNTINPVIQNDVPDPLDQEIDNPLM